MAEPFTSLWQFQVVGQVSAATLIAGVGSDSLLITHPEKGWLGAKTTKVGLPGIGKQEAQLRGVVGQYWQRHQIMRNNLND
jgi:hypothetical protein